MAGAKTRFGDMERTPSRWVPLAAAALLATSAPAVAAEGDWAATPEAGAAAAATVEWLALRDLGRVLDAEFALDRGDATSLDGFASTQFGASRLDPEAAADLAHVARTFAALESESVPGLAADAERAFRIACVAVGSDRAVAESLGDELGGGIALFDGCADSDRDIQTEGWDVALSGATLFSDEPPAEVVVEYGDTDAHAAERDWLRGTGVLEGVASAARVYAFVEPLRIEARECGEDVGREPDTVLVCYETVAAIGRAARELVVTDRGEDGIAPAEL